MQKWGKSTILEQVFEGEEQERKSNVKGKVKGKSKDEKNELTKLAKLVILLMHWSNRQVQNDL